MAALAAPAAPAFAWGDEGHEIVAHVAEHYLKPVVRARAQALLGLDASGMTATDLAAEATWADKYRDSDRHTSMIRYDHTRLWHFVDLELDGPNIDAACFDHPGVAAGTPASQGPAQDCVVDKIEQFRTELASASTSAAERLAALQFLLHFVGDLHQPLHASDDHDQGGNRKRVSAEGERAGNLHHYWDTEFVLQLGSDPAQVADALIKKITPEQLHQWRSGTPRDWALETFAVARASVYAPLPPANEWGSYRLSAGYVANATAAVATQLSRAGVRLALLLNEALE
jgi:hypothetical protein